MKSMVLKTKFTKGTFSELKVSPNVGGEYSKKDKRNLQKWVANLNKQPDVESCKLEEKG